MNAVQKTDAFLEKLKEDSVRCRKLETAGYSLREKKNIIRSLMNIRMPGKMSAQLLELQDRYLQEELKIKGTVTLSQIPTIQERTGSADTSFNSTIPFAEKLSIWQGDITRLKVGAIVNAANSQMLGCFVPCHNCIDNAIHSAAGMQLREECSRIMERRRTAYGRGYEEPVGTATLTPAYNLPCDYIIHTVGPIVRHRLDDTLCRNLHDCYESALNCCLEHNIKSVAFCCISTGEFHFPNEKAAQIAVETTIEFLKTYGGSIERILFNVFKDTDREIYEKLLSQPQPR